MFLLTYLITRQRLVGPGWRVQDPRPGTKASYARSLVSYRTIGERTCTRDKCWQRGDHQQWHCRRLS